MVLEKLVTYAVLTLTIKCQPYWSFIWQDGKQKWTHTRPTPLWMRWELGISLIMSSNCARSCHTPSLSPVNGVGFRNPATCYPWWPQTVREVHTHPLPPGNGVGYRNPTHSCLWWPWTVTEAHTPPSHPWMGQHLWISPTSTHDVVELWQPH